MKKVIIAIGLILILAALAGGFFALFNNLSSTTPDNNSLNTGNSGNPSSPNDDKTYYSISSNPAKFPAGTLVAKHASVPDVVQLTKDVGQYKQGDLLIYYVDFSQAAVPGSENISVISSSNNAVTWGNKRSIVLSGKVNKGAAVDPSIVQLPDGRLRLYYFGSEVTDGDPAQQTQPHRVYSAISTDGIHFAVESGYRFENAKLTDPEVIYWHNLWYMYYSVGTNTQLAISSDGLTFTPKTISDGGVGGVPGALPLNNGIRIYGCTQGISTAISTNGLNFTKDGSNIVPGGTCDPSVIQLNDGQYMLVYKVSPNLPTQNQPNQPPPLNNQPMQGQPNQPPPPDNQPMTPGN